MKHLTHDIIGTRRPETAGLPMFDGPVARSNDPETSHAAGEAVRQSSGTIRHALLLAYAAHPAGLTDEEAGDIVNRDGAWKRCSDLRRDGYVTPLVTLRKGSSGHAMRVCAITEKGRREIANA